MSKQFIHPFFFSFAHIKPAHFLVLFLFFIGCINNQSEERGKVGTQAPSFLVVDMEGNQYASSELKGKVVVLNFWFIGCPPCIREIPELNNLVQKYKEKDVVFLAFARDSKRKLKNFLAKKKFEYNIVSKANRIAKLFNTHGWPTNIIIDSNGEIVFHKAAYAQEQASQMDEMISSLLIEG